MYAIKNNVQLIGRLVKKPVIAEYADGRKWARFSIVIEDSYHNAQGTYIKDDQKHRVVAQGRIASLAEKTLDKGMVVAVSGRLVNRDFMDGSGVYRSVTEVLINELLILDMYWQEQDEYNLYICNQSDKLSG